MGAIAGDSMRLIIVARRHVVSTLVCTAALAAVLTAAEGDKGSKASMTLKATPAVGFAPVRMVFTAELKGDEHADLYCPAIEWVWGDDTRSETRTDCDPFELSLIHI